MQCDIYCLRIQVGLPDCFSLHYATCPWAISHIVISSCLSLRCQYPASCRFRHGFHPAFATFLRVVRRWCTICSSNVCDQFMATSSCAPGCALTHLYDERCCLVQNCLKCILTSQPNVPSMARESLWSQDGWVKVLHCCFPITVGHSSASVDLQSAYPISQYYRLPEFVGNLTI